MPKMILVITLVVMLGSLFGAVSYLLKTPKTDLPIVNPVVETQCEVDSDCYLVYVSDKDYVCQPCDKSSEKYQCLIVDEMKKLENKGNKIDKSVLCSPCSPEFDKYTCKCANGKCEKVKKEEVEEVVITTDKMEYEVGEEVKIVIKNNSDEKITFGIISLEIDSGEMMNLWGVDGDSMQIPVFDELVKDIYCDCNNECKKLPLSIKANLNEKYVWDQKIGLCDELSLGIKLRFGIKSWDSGYINYSNEFTIKEKSALDARCGEKVRDTNSGGNSCDTLYVGYEFDSETKKCIKRSVLICSIISPFKTLEECQEICEKNMNSYICPNRKSIDCMPIVLEENKLYCEKNYRQWIEKNCDIFYTD